MSKFDKFFILIFTVGSIYFLFIDEYVVSAYYLIILGVKFMQITSENLIKLVELKERENPVINIGDG